MPGDMTKGYTGWGDDCPQFAVFGSKQIISAIDNPVNKTRNFDSIQQKSIIKDSQGKKLKLYHSTKDFFHNFKISNDIGYHFGSKKASLDRFNSGYNPEFKILKESSSQASESALKIISLSESGNIGVKALNLLLRKLKYPKSNLKEMILSMSDNEIKKIISDYQEKEDSDNFKLQLIKKVIKNHFPYCVMTLK